MTWWGWFLGWWHGTPAAAEGPGLEHTLPGSRLHHTLPDSRLHHTLPDCRLHHTIPEEDESA